MKQKKRTVSGFILLAILTGCEDVYVADLDVKNHYPVVEARINASSANHSIHIYRTVGFYDAEIYPPVLFASVCLIDDQNEKLPFTHSENGKYDLNQPIHSGRSYKLQIVYDGETYESPYVDVPEIPYIDTVYAEAMSKNRINYDKNGIKTIESQDGIQFYADITSPTTPSYYRFYGRKIRMSTFPFDTVMGTSVTVSKYVWKSFYPDGGFNVAGPAKYAAETTIHKHPLEFITAEFSRLLNWATNERERGWIYIIHQYSIPVSAYQFYTELNKQLESEGKMFAPMYSQAFGNIKCRTNNRKVILGNFEIQNYREHRYFLKLLDKENHFRLEKMDTFYPIPTSGIQSVYPPDFWRY
jgi:hypothetical protein